MDIGRVNVRISALPLAAFAFFSLVVIASVVVTGDTSILLWGIPTLVLLLIIPGALNYMSQSQYIDLIPVYEREAKEYRVRMINETLLNKPVRIKGVVERASFKYLNRPQFSVADRTGEISVKMFTSPQEDINKDDVVEVLGMVIRRFVVAGEPVINCVSIRKIEAEKKK
ncbi:nucleotide-binding protein [Methanofollis formosanus]|uniref:Nucleotide-binding protein n=1 Tax=Methanofollis formosanus TaxID=299308 RepID=A0A8G1A4G5_9EURY|nr:nucleotide-binding protein [Methanofollis formosanus]QYZ79917.1 nucleotide-binding protein [Methanofollis formosanus]